MSNVVTMQKPNDTRLADFWHDVQELAEADADGKDALPNVAFKFIRAVAEEVIDTTKDANGDDAAARVFKRYSEISGKKQIHDRSADSVKAQISKLRAVQRAASNPKWDFVQVGNHVFSAIQDFKKEGIDTKSTYAALVDVSREQCKSDQELTYDEVAVICLPTTKVKEVTLESKLEKIKKDITKIITGENADQIMDQSPELMQAEELINERVKQLMQLAQTAADNKALADIAQRRGGVILDI